MQSLALPQLLVATPQLQDPNFQYAVMLMVEHDENGALGFIINRPSDLPLAAILKNEALNVPNKIPTWNGGPVGTDHGLILTNERPLETAADDFNFEQLSVSSSEYSLARLIEYAEEFDEKKVLSDANPILYPFRFLVGHAGWGAGQLDQELREGSWLQLPYDEALVFSTPWPRIWKAAFDRLGIAASGVISTPANEYLQ